MKNTAELLGFELRKICGKRIVQIGLIVMLGIVPVGMFVSAFFATTTWNDEIVTVYERGQRLQKALTPLNGASMDDAFFGTAEGSDEARENFFEKVGVKEGTAAADEALEAIIMELGASPDTIGAKNYYDALDREFAKAEEYLHLSDAARAYWNARWQQVTRPYIYGYVGGAESRCAVFYSVIVFSIFVISISLAQVYAEEHRRKTDALILCSTNGKARLYGIKFLAGVLFGVLISAVQAAEYVLIYGIIDGFGGGEFQIQMRLAYSPYALTFGELFLILCGLYLLSTALVSAFSLMLSELTKNALAAMAVPIVILVATLIYEIPETYPLLNAIEQYLPGNNLGVWQVYNLWTVPLGAARLDFFQSAAIFYAILTAAFFFIGRRTYLRTEMGGR